MKIDWNQLRIIANAIRGDGRFKNFRFWMIGKTIKGQAYAGGYWLGNSYEFVVKAGKLKNIIGPL